MVEVKKGTIITATDIKAGTGKNGTWAFGKVKAEKGYDAITVWFANPEVYKDITDYKIVSIESVKKTARKVKDAGGAEKWYDEYSCNAVMEVLPVPGDAPEGFSRLDADIPF